jgi:class 3 adenylate cyclase/tetratricopeptide (TPR) repeat protein
VTEPRRERKVVTVLFADLVGFTARSESLDPEDVEAILRPYHARLREELEQRGGTVEKFVGDAVMAVFGAPTAHEDDPERAVRAALAIRDSIVEDGTLEVRVGVNTGEALVNIDARPDHGEGMVSGDVVNTAARLQAAAPTNGVLVGESTHRATASTIDYREHTAVDAKGKTESVLVWEADQARARVGVERPAPATPLVGRERERELLRDAFERVRDDESPQLVTIVGVPGIGKSRLVSELYADREREAALTNWRLGRSLSYGEALPYAAFAEVVKAHAGILEGDAPEAAQEKLAEAVTSLAPDDAEWLTERLLPLVGAGGAAGERADSFAAWRRFVEALAERPTVLVFEDLHWADDDLLDFVDHLAEWTGPVPLLIVATARPELLDRRPAWGGGKRNALTISLGPLDDDETAQLLAALLGRAVVEADTQSTLLARAEGNPLYADQFVRMLAERGEVTELPETVQGIIAARLDALPLGEKELVQDAAVFGRIFWLGALQAVAGVERQDAEERLHALERKEFVRRERRPSVAGESEYSFVHLLLRDVAYAQIPRAARAEKHRRAALWVESIAAEERVDMLAHHYLSALELVEAAGGVTDELRGPARAAVSEAATRAAALKSYPLAVRLYRRALELTEVQDDAWPALVFQREQAVWHGGDACDVNALRAVVERLLAGGDVDGAAQAETLAALSWWLLGDREQADLHMDRALELVGDLPPSPAKVEVLVERSRLSMLGGEQLRSVELGEEGLALAEELGLERLQASALITVGVALGQVGDAGRGTELLERGLELALRLKEPQQVQRGYNNLAQLRAQSGDYSGVVDLYRAAERFVAEYGFRGSLRWLEAQEAMVAFTTGDWATAERLSDEFVEESEGGTPHYLEGQIRFVRAHLLYARGDVDAALDESQRAVELSRRARDPQAIGTTLAAHAVLLLHEGRIEDTAAITDELDAIRGGEGGFGYFTWIVWLAWLARDLGRAESFRDPAGHEPRQTPWIEAGHAIVEGDFARAADVLERMGVAPDEAYARLRAAEQLAAEGKSAEAAEQRDRALTFYRSVGATRYVRRAEKLLPASA